MDIRIVVLDDNLETAGGQIRDSLRPLTVAEERLELSGSRTATLELQEIHGEKVTLHFSCNPVDYATLVKQLIEEGHFHEQYDLVLLDDNWGSTSAEKLAGQQLLLDPAFKHLKGPTEEGPIICLWTQHWDETFRTDELARTLRREPFWGETRVRGLAKSNYPGLLLLIQDVIALSRLQRRTLQLEEELANTRAVAAERLELFKREQFQQNLVPHHPFFNVAEKLTPFFQWKDGIYDSIRDDFKMAFPTGLLFSYRDDAWLTVVCETLAQALGSQERLIEAHLSDGDGAPLLLEEATEIYAKALHDQIVVIRAENITWPTVLDNESQVKWQNFSQSLARLLRSAAEINSGRMPTDQDIQSQILTSSTVKFLRGTFPFAGKILWFLAYKNGMFNGLLDPIEPMLRPAIRLEFPTEELVRRKYLKIYANKQRCDFQPAALKLTSKRTLDYSFKDLIGDPHLEANGSFVSLAANKSRLVAQQSLNEADIDDKHSRPLITEQIVEQVLAELDPVEEFVSDIPAGSGQRDIQNMSGLSSEKSSERLARAEQFLDTVQAALVMAKQEQPDIKRGELRRALARILGVTPSSISMKANDYYEELRTSLRDPEKAARWPDVGEVSTFKKFL